MKAYEMFDELGYECQYTKQCIYYRKIDYSFMRVVVEIRFKLHEKTYCCECGMATRIPSEKEKGAIKKQMEELGWIEKGTKQ